MKTIYTTGIAMAAALGMFSTGSAIAPTANAAEVDGLRLSGMSRYGANAPLRRASKSCPPW